jgi:tetratricopeptide (TPR) repeat protein
MESLSLRPAGRNQSLHFEPELGGCSALILDSDNTSRSILAAQLRDFGFSEVVQQSRIHHARETLELRRFDVLLCAQYFGADSPTGQDLLDDLRRDALLPFSTVFIMVTTEASYAKVEQAAESALDGYLLKPHSAASLVQRLLAARRRKQELADIFAALEAQDLPLAIAQCLQRYESRGVFWLYSARLGAELLLRTAQYEQARALYQSVVTATAEPWARAGVARALLSTGQYGKATLALQELTQQLPDYVDAYDVLGRAQLKLGQLEDAMASYRKANALTPSSIARLQRLGMLAYYLGDAAEAERLLDQATHLGQDSRSYDYQTLALLALLRTAQGNWTGVQRCRDVAHAMLRKAPDSVRLQRVGQLVEAVALLHQHALPEALAIARKLSGALAQADFDFDLACNLLSLLSLLASEDGRRDENADLVTQLGHRYCTSDATTALLLAAARAHEPFVQLIRQCNEHVLAVSEQAMKMHLQGDYRGAIAGFLSLADSYLNARLFEAANQLYQRHAADLPDAQDYRDAIQSLRERAGVARARPGFGDSQGRPPAGVMLRISAPLPEAMSNW